MGKKTILIITLFLIVAVLAGSFLYIRSALFSEHLGRLITPELSRLTGQKVSIERVYLNPFPFFIGIREMQLGDKSDSSYLYIRKARIFIRPSSLLRRKIVISHASIDTFLYSSEGGSLKDLGWLVAFGKLRTSIGDWDLAIGKIALKNGGIRVYYRKDDRLFTVNGIKASGSLLKKRWKISSSDLSFTDKGAGIFKGTLNTEMLFSDGRLSFSSFSLRGGDSSLALSGLYDKGVFDGTIDARLSVKMLSNLFAPGTEGAGSADIKGRLSFEVPKNWESLADLGSGLSLDAHTKGSVYLETLMNLTGLSFPASGRAEYDGLIKGPVLNPDLKLDIELNNGLLSGIKTESLKGKVLYKNKRLTLQRCIAKVFGGKAGIEAAIDLHKPENNIIRVSLDSLNSHDLLSFLGLNTGLPQGTVSGDLHTEGAQLEPSGSLHFISSDRAKKQEDETQSPVSPLIRKIKDIRGSFSKKGELIALKDLKVSLESTEIYAEGSINISEKTLDLKTSLVTSDIRELYTEGNIRGDGKFSGRIRGEMDHPGISGNVTLCNLYYTSISLGCLRARINYSKNSLTIDDLLGELNGAGYSLEGSIKSASALPFTFVDPEVDLHGTLTDLNLSDLIHLIPQGVTERLDFKDGRLDTVFRLSGKLSDLSADGNLQVSGLKFHQSKIKPPLFTADFTYREGKVKLTNLLLTVGSSELQGDALITLDGKIERSRLTIALSSNDINWTYPVPFSIDGSLAVTGTLDAPEAELEGTIKSYGLRELSNAILSKPSDSEPHLIRAGNIHMKLRERVLIISSDLFQKRLYLTGLLNIGDEPDWSLNIEVREGDYRGIAASLVSTLPPGFGLSMNGNISLFGTAGSITGTAAFDMLKISSYGEMLVNTEKVLIKIEDSAVEFESFELKTDAATLDIVGSIDFPKNLDLAVSGEGRLEYLRTLFPELLSFQGTSYFMVSISGEPEAPVVNAVVVVEDTKLSIRGIPGKIYSLKGEAYVDENKIILEDLSGRYASGSIKIKGAARLENWKIINYNLEGALNGIKVSFDEEVLLTLSGDLFMLKRDNTHNLIGDLRILEGSFRKNIDWKEWVLGEKAAIIKKPGAGRLPDTVRLNIKLYGDEDIMIDNNLMAAPARVDIVVLGTMERPAVIGRIELKGGEIFFRNNEFSILNASADFTDTTKIYPFLNVEAITKVKAYKIYFGLSGHIDQFSLALSSEPFLKETEILSLLTVGGAGTNIKGMEGGIDVSEATSFLTGRLTEFLEERMKELTGFDKLHMEPYISEKSGTISPRISASKKLFSDKLQATFSTLLGSTQEEFLQLEYRLTDRMIIVGEKDELGSIGADIKYRLEFK